MMTIKELALSAGVPAHVARYYVRIGLIEASGQLDNGYRLFSQRDVERIRFIRMAQQLGFTLNEVRKIFLDVADATSPCPDVREMLTRRIDENRKKIAELTALQARMESARSLWKWMPDGHPGGGVICPLIESVVSTDPDTSVSGPAREVQDAAS